MKEHDKGKLDRLWQIVEELYHTQGQGLPFHGWHHILFVARKATTFAEAIGVDTFIVTSAALVHDLNYLVKRRSTVDVGERLRREILHRAGYEATQITKIEGVVCEADVSQRGKDICEEAQALSDGDMLFKALPFTPILLAREYMRENNVSIEELGSKILTEQERLMSEDIYFYTEVARRLYMPWAQANLSLWRLGMGALQDSDVQILLRMTERSSG